MPKWVKVLLIAAAFLVTLVLLLLISSFIFPEYGGGGPVGMWGIIRHILWYLGYMWQRITT